MWPQGFSASLRLRFRYWLCHPAHGELRAGIEPVTVRSIGGRSTTELPLVADPAVARLSLYHLVIHRSANSVKAAHDG